MSQQSRPVISNQAHLHRDLSTVVQRHLASEFRRPVAPHSSLAFEALEAAMAQNPRPLVIDSFCGTGHSSALLAQRHPNHWVVGVDKSAHRLNKHPVGDSDNYLLLQADCEDIWQLLLHRAWRADYHYLLYPNPWPKAKHLQRRVHGSGAFTRLLQLGGEVELRSNWQTYVEEFGTAMHLAGQRGAVSQLQASIDLTLFESKYRRSGHSLWAYRGRIAPVTRSA